MGHDFRVPATHAHCVEPPLLFGPHNLSPLEQNCVEVGEKTSQGAHSRRCAGSVSACQIFSVEWRSSLTRMSVHFSPSFRTCAPLAGPGAYCSRSVIFFTLSSRVPAG